MSTEMERRSERRVAFTLVRTAGENEDGLPVWEFSTPTQALQQQGWVLDMSKGGMQVLVPRLVPLRDVVYDVLVEAGGAAGECIEARVRRVWSRDVAHLGQLNGFEFDEPQPLAETFLARHPAAKGQGLKCLSCQLVAR
jgi:hypothetical protein